MKALVIGARDGNIGEGIAYEINRLYGMPVHRTSVGALDVRSSADVRTYIKEQGPFEHFVYCAGLQHLEMIPDLTDDAIDDIFDVNVQGFLRVMRELTANQDSGNVLALVSDASYTPMRGSINYCASKAALAMAVRVAARELAPRWRVNGLSPTVVEGTPMTAEIDAIVPALRGWSVEEAQAYERSMIPMQRRVRVSEVVTLAMDILFGPQMLTGSIINMTGGK